MLNPQLTSSNQPESENFVNDRYNGGKDRLDILVVEDNDDLRNMIRDILQNEYRVNEAVDGLEGMENASGFINLLT